MQPLDLRDDHRLCRHPCGIVGRQAGGDLLQVLEPHGDMKPIQDRRSDDAGIGKNAAKARATIGEGGHRRVLGSADGIEVAADQLLDVGIGADDSAENLAATRRRFDIADPHLKMPLTIRTAADKGRIQAHHDRRRRRSRPGRRTIPQRLAGSQGVAAQGLMVLAGVDREHLLQHLSGRPVGHQGGAMRLKLIQFRGRPTMRRPADTSLDPATRGTAKPRKPHRDLAEKRRYATLPVILHMANRAAARAGRPPSSVVPGLPGDDRLLQAGQQPLRIGQGQTQISDIAEIGGPHDLHHVRAMSLAPSPGFHHPHNPGHPSTPGHKQQTQKISLDAIHPHS